MQNTFSPLKVGILGVIKLCFFVFSDGTHYFYGYGKLHFSSCLWSIISALTLRLNLQQNINPQIHNALTDS